MAFVIKYAKVKTVSVTSFFPMTFYHKLKCLEHFLNLEVLHR